jgi:hypothetical protein
MFKNLTAAEHPERLTLLDVSGQQVVFVLGADDQYAAECGGKKLPIRVTEAVREVPGSRLMYEPKVQEGETANIDPLLYCVSLGPKITSAGPNSITLTASDNWGHYRQWTFLTITVTLTPSGVVEIQADIGEEDGSYY